MTFSFSDMFVISAEGRRTRVSVAHRTLSPAVSSAAAARRSLENHISQQAPATSKREGDGAFTLKHLTNIEKLAKRLFERVQKDESSAEV